MSKFQIGQRLKLNQYYVLEGKRIFGETWNPKQLNAIVTNIIDDGKHEILYQFGTDKEGNIISYAETFLELV